MTTWVRRSFARKGRGADLAERDFTSDFSIVFATGHLLSIRDVRGEQHATLPARRLTCREMKWLFGGKSKKQPEDIGTLDHLTLQQLAKAGGNLAKPTNVINYLYVPDEQLAQEAGSELRQAGYSVEVRPAATGSNWLALAKIDLVPSAENIRLLRQRFETLASRLGGEYDGWEAAVTE